MTTPTPVQARQPMVIATNPEELERLTFGELLKVGKTKPLAEGQTSQPVKRNPEPVAPDPAELAAVQAKAQQVQQDARDTVPAGRRLAKYQKQFARAYNAITARQVKPNQRGVVEATGCSTRTAATILADLVTRYPAEFERTTTGRVKHTGKTTNVA